MLLINGSPYKAYKQCVYSQLSNKRPRSFINFWENFLSGRLILDRSFIFLWQMCHFRSGRLFILLYESGFFPTQVALILDRSFIFSSLVARRVVYLIRSSIEELRVYIRGRHKGCKEKSLMGPPQPSRTWHD